MYGQGLWTLFRTTSLTLSVLLLFFLLKKFGLVLVIGSLCPDTPKRPMCLLIPLDFDMKRKKDLLDMGSSLKS